MLIENLSAARLDALRAQPRMEIRWVLTAPSEEDLLEPEEWGAEQQATPLLSDFKAGVLAQVVALAQQDVEPEVVD